jgi:hypothetical protein
MSVVTIKINFHYNSKSTLSLWLEFLFQENGDALFLQNSATYKEIFFYKENLTVFALFPFYLYFEEEMLFIFS